MKPLIEFNLEQIREHLLKTPEYIETAVTFVKERKDKLDSFRETKVPTIKKIIKSDVNHYCKSRWIWTKDMKGLGDLYSPDHRSFNRREWKGFLDTAYDFRRWLKLYGHLIINIGPVAIPAVKALFRYAWMPSFMAVTEFMDRHKMGYRGKDLRYVEESFFTLIYAAVWSLRQILERDENLRPYSFRAHKLRERTLIFDEMTPVSVMMGFNEKDIDWLDPIGIGLAIANELDQHMTMYYIDASERMGLPPEVCGYPSADIGLCIVDDVPRVGKAFYATSMPCDGSLVATMFLMRHMPDIPTYVLSTAQRYNEKDANDYSVYELKHSIEWVEDQFDIKWDWDYFWKKAEEYNTTTECMIEKWNVNCTPYPQICGSSQAIQRQLEFQLFGCMIPYLTKTDVKLTKLMLKGYEYDKKHDIRPYRYKAMIWGCPSHYHSHFTSWLEHAWGIKIVLDMETMLSYHMYHIGDKESAMYDLAHSYERMMMRSHSNGGYQNWVDECWRMFEKFDVELVVNYDHITCHNGGGLTGIIDDGARDRGINMIWVPHDLMEPRSISRKDMRESVNKYMFNVFGDDPLDPTLIDFEDGKAF